MKLFKNSTLAFSHLLQCLLVVSSLFGTVEIEAAPLRCVDVLKENVAPKSIMHYIRQVRSEKPNAPTPRFLDPAQEINLATRWKGTKEAPESVRQTLLESTSLLDFQLLAADSGSVKIAQPGNFTSFRLTHTWKDKDMSTNVGLPIEAILARGFEKSDKLVPEQAKAVFIFMHGGGTKTTGHHVAASLSNFLANFGIVVLSIDAPYHAYGSRERNIPPLEFYKYLRDFRHQFIPENVPTFLGGHSMGGLHADNLMRLSDQTELGLKEAFVGLINLSGPLDNAPGKSIAEKNAAEEKIHNNKELMDLVPEAERDLSVLLLTQGKTSALSGISTESFMGIVNWQKPQHGGQDYIPTLAIMGARDALYVGREAIFKEYLTDLANVESHVMDLRKDFKGRDMWVSHMIFDHYRKGTEQPETFHLMKEFIEKQMGSKLETNGNQLLGEFNASNVGIVSHIVQEYYINLAFRRFAHQYTHLVRTGTDKLSEIGQKTSELSKELKSLKAQIKQMEKQDPENSELASLKKRSEEIHHEISNFRTLQQSQYVPESNAVLKKFAEDNIARRVEINDVMQKNIKAKRQLMQELREVRSKKDQYEKRLDELVEQAIEKDIDTNSSLIKARDEYIEAIDYMVDLQVKMNELNSEMVQKGIEENNFEINPSPELIQVYKDLDSAYGRYNDTLAIYQEAVKDAMSKGALGLEGLEVLTELWGSIPAYEAKVPKEASLLARTEKLSDKVEQLELENSELLREQNILLATYIRNVTPDLFNVRITTMAQEMNRPLDELLTHTSQIERIWKDWTEMWKERPPEKGTSLY